MLQGAHFVVHALYKVHTREMRDDARPQKITADLFPNREWGGTGVRLAEGTPGSRAARDRAGSVAGAVAGPSGCHYAVRWAMDFGKSGRTW